MGILAAQAIPAYHLIVNLCKGAGLREADVIGDCRAVALALERGDTYITEMVGVIIAKRVWPADSAEWKEAGDARRVYQYRSRLFQRIAFSSLKDEVSASRYLALCAQNRREQDVQRAALIDGGTNPDPPPDWIP
jgi:hypothetical protein